MAPSEETAPEPRIDRPTKMRWGSLLILLLGGGVLVVGVIIPILGSARMSGGRVAETQLASGIFKSMMLYSQDHNGQFPTAEHSSNQAFRQLFPDYIEREIDFFVPSSAWHRAARNKRGPDGDIGSRPDYAQCLERGENHWAYVSGLNANSPATLPVIADGFVENQPGTYTDDPTKKGGLWKGTKAIVVFMDLSAKAIPISVKSHFRVLRPDPKTGKSVDIFTPDGGLPQNARVLNPW